MPEPAEPDPPTLLNALFDTEISFRALLVMGLIPLVPVGLQVLVALVGALLRSHLPA